MFTKFNFELEYEENGLIKRAEGIENELYSLQVSEDENRFKATLIPKTTLHLRNAYVTTSFDFLESDKVYINGYQSWTTSREYGKNDLQRGLNGLGNCRPVRSFTSIFGDYDFQTYSKKKGVFHSYSYTYIKREDKIFIFGSLSERFGFTVFHFDMNQNVMSVQKDVEGVTVSENYEIFNFSSAVGAYDNAFDDYFRMLALPNPRFGRMTGYTSWYNYFGGITEEILTRDLDGLATIGDKADIFQIDDGYQIKTGDWLTLKHKKYPKGMKYIVDKIHAHGYKAGLWLAPFNAQRSSNIAKTHKEWLIKDKDGKPQLGSISWNGAYTLDFYNQEAADYIRSVFRGVLDEWGFDMVKLDFLYSICRTPRYNKSRGQIMTEAMEFLRECVGEKIMLGCGVPLFPSFGTCDFCRISCDVAVSFADAFYIKHTNQEIVCTRNAINNTLFRRHLDGRAFINDPDVFFLRENDLTGKDRLFLSKGRLKFSDRQKKLLATVNGMCGNVLFVSDNVGGYGAVERKILEETFMPTDKKVTDVNYLDKEHIEVLYLSGKEPYKLTLNISTGFHETVKL